MADHIDYGDLRADAVRQVAKLMAAAAITAPKSGGQLFLAAKHLFIETAIDDDRDTLAQLATWMPDDHAAGERLDRAVDPEPDQGDRAGGDAGADSDRELDEVPGVAAPGEQLRPSFERGAVVRGGAVSRR